MDSGQDVQAPEAPQPVLRGLIADLMRADPGELVPMLNALFGLELPGEAALDSPAPAALAQRVQSAWFAAGGTGEELSERLEALADDL